jgi:hypothetical protein
MPRALHIDDDALTVRFSGWMVLGTLQRRVRLPYAAVRSVRVEPWPRREAHGRFARNGRRLFFSFDDPHRVVRLDLVGGPYDEAVIGAPDPRALARAIECRRARLDPAPARAA